MLRKAVKGMLPRNRLARQQISKLKIYAGPEHPHEAQAPEDVGGLVVAEQAQYLGTGKRKTSVARVILRPGDGKTWFNGRTLEDYFPRPTHRTLALAPLKTAGVEGTFDLRVRVHGGGPSGQAGAVRHGIARALVEADPGAARAAQARGLPHPRRPLSRAQEGRAAQGPQGPAVLQALTSGLPRGISGPTASGASSARI